MINSRKLTDLLPGVADKCRNFIDGCTDAGINALITSTYRDVEAQNAIYAQGRTTPGHVITNARGGDSMHQYRVAFDWVPVDLKGQPIWSDMTLWSKGGAIGQSVGLEWGGSWTSFIDRPHFQDTGGKTLADFKAEAK